MLEEAWDLFGDPTDRQTAPFLQDLACLFGQGFEPTIFCIEAIYAAHKPIVSLFSEHTIASSFNLSFL